MEKERGAAKTWTFKFSHLARKGQGLAVVNSTENGGRAKASGFDVEGRERKAEAAEKNGAQLTKDVTEV